MDPSSFHFNFVRCPNSTHFLHDVFFFFFAFFQCHACTHHFNNSRFVALCVSFFFFFPFFDLAYPPVTQNMCKRKDDASTYTHSTYIRKSSDRTKHQRDNNEQTYSHICSKQVEAFVLYALRTNTDTVSISIRTNTGLVNEEKK